MSIRRKDFKKCFPHLAEEIESKKMSLSIDEVQNEAAGEDTADSPLDIKHVHMDIIETEGVDIWRGFDPQAEDFIRRASTVAEAIEIIEFLIKRKELSEEKAEELLHILHTQGLQAFGPHKRPGYYLIEAEKEELRLLAKRSPLSKG